MDGLTFIKPKMYINYKLSKDVVTFQNLSYINKGITGIKQSSISKYIILEYKSAESLIS